jgi:hypothetical protein
MGNSILEKFLELDNTFLSKLKSRVKIKNPFKALNSRMECFLLIELNSLNGSNKDTLMAKIPYQTKILFYSFKINFKSLEKFMLFLNPKTNFGLKSNKLEIPKIHKLETASKLMILEINLTSLLLVKAKKIPNLAV